MGWIKHVQKQLKNSHPDVTLQNYLKEIPESVAAMVDSMYEQIAGLDPGEALAQMAVSGGNGDVPQSHTF